MCSLFVFLSQVSPDLFERFLLRFFESDLTCVLVSECVKVSHVSIISSLLFYLSPGAPLCQLIVFFMFPILCCPFPLWLILYTYLVSELLFWFFFTLPLPVVYLGYWIYFAHPWSCLPHFFCLGEPGTIIPSSKNSLFMIATGNLSLFDMFANIIFQTFIFTENANRIKVPC